METTLKRREFLKKSAVSGLLATPCFVFRSVLGRGGQPGPNSKITIGCIGVGGMGTGNMRNFLGLPEECRVVAVCDAYEDRRQKAKELVDNYNHDKDCRMYGDYREILARKDIDAVMIAAQDHWHALIATEAARAGKDMYCEKPLGVSTEESRMIRDVIRRERRVFQTGTWQRSERKFQRACQLVRNGYVGKIHTIQVATPGPKYQPKYQGSLDPQPVPTGFDWEMWRGPAPAQPYNPGRVDWPDWYLIWDYCFGFSTNWGVHHLDIANWGCPSVGEEAFTVECKATYRNKGLTDNVESWFATFEYASGLKMVFSDDFQQKVGCRFIGDEGWVHVDRAGLWAEPESLLKIALKPGDVRLTESDHHQADFLNCVRTRNDPVSNVDAAHTATCLGMIADIAGRAKAKLTWNHAKAEFEGHDEANRFLRRPMHNGWKLVS